MKLSIGKQENTKSRKKAKNVLINAGTEQMRTKNASKKIIQIICRIIKGKLYENKTIENLSINVGSEYNILGTRLEKVRFPTLIFIAGIVFILIFNIFGAITYFIMCIFWQTLYFSSISFLIFLYYGDKDKKDESKKILSDIIFTTITNISLFLYIIGKFSINFFRSYVSGLSKDQLLKP